MTYAILLERVEDEGFPAGYYYAHIPSLGLVTHGLGIEGARQAAGDLLQQWIAVLKQAGLTEEQFKNL